MLRKFPDYAKGIAGRTAAVNRYKTEHLEPYCKEYVGFDALCAGSLNYDLVLVGSDQVWLPLGLYTKFHNLLFVHETVPKVAYSSSFGVSQIPWWQKKQTKHYLERFDAIAVREIKGKEIVETLSNKKATVVLDPTLMISSEQWRAEADRSEFRIEEEYIFCYFLGNNPESRKAVTMLSRQTGLKIVFMPHMDEYIPSDEGFADYAPYEVSPVDFISLLRGAKYVCTDSFHATIFSLKFKKKFLTFYRFDPKSSNSRNSRIDSLFNLLGLQDRLFRGDNVVSQIKTQIDYEVIDGKLSELIKNSLKFLEESLALSHRA